MKPESVIFSIFIYSLFSFYVVAHNETSTSSKFTTSRTTQMTTQFAARSRKTKAIPSATQTISLKTETSASSTTSAAFLKAKITSEIAVSTNSTSSDSTSSPSSTAPPSSSSTIPPSATSSFSSNSSSTLLTSPATPSIVTTGESLPRSSVTSASNSTESNSLVSPLSPNKTVWLTESFTRAKESFWISTNGSSTCQNDFNIFKLSTLNQTVWAIRMLESSEWPLVGLFSGKLFHTGDYDECLRATAPNFTGKYCLVRAILNITKELNITSGEYFDDTGWPNETASVWDITSLFNGNPKRRSRNIYTWAMCLPSSCSVIDIEVSLNHTLQPIFQENGLEVKVEIDPYLCSVKDNSSYPLGFYCAWLVFLLIISLVITSTIYDLRADSFTGENDCWLAIKLFKCFSIRHSYVNLTQYKTSVSTNPGFYLIKIVYFFFIVVGHRMFNNGLAFSTSQSEELEMTNTSDFVYLLNMDVIDVFFMLTGFLTFHLGYLPMKTIGYSYFFMSIGIRWLKLMPVYGLLLLFITQIFPHSGEGPWWKYRVLREVDNCRATWWTQLIALSNIVNSKQQCLMISWYLSVEIQLAIIGAVILLITSKNRKMGFLCIVLTFFVFTELSGIIAYRKHYHGNLIIFAKRLEHLKDSEEFYRYYISGVTRVGPYLVGFAAAFISKILKDRDYRFSHRKKFFIIASTYFMGQGVLYCGFIFYNQNERYIPLDAIYAAVHRPIYVLPLATTLCIYFTSGLGVFNHLFEMKIFIPFGRLVYSAFLVHCVVQLYHVSTQRGLLLIPKSLNLSYTVTADIVHSFVVGLFLFIIAEGPFHSITHLLHPQLTGTRRKSIQPLEEYISKRGFNNKAFAQDDDETTVC